MKEQMENEWRRKDKLNKIGKTLDKIFMAQRAKGRMALDHWNGWLKDIKSG